MRKKVILVFALTGSMLVGATAASAASVDMRAPAPRVPAAAKLALAGVSTAAQSDQDSLPGTAQPKTKKKRRFFGLPLLGIFAAGGVGVAAASDDDCTCEPASP